MPNTTVWGSEGDTINAVTGPPTCFQVVVLIVAPPLPVAAPSNCVEVPGKVSSWPFPALTDGGVPLEGEVLLDRRIYHHGYVGSIGKSIIIRHLQLEGVIPRDRQPREDRHKVQR